MKPLTPPSRLKRDVGRYHYCVITWFTHIRIMRVFVFLTDRSVSLDQILIQLKEVTPKWRELAEAVGVENLDEISDYVREELKIL